MSTSTPNFGWQLPVPNSPVDANVWGTELNGNISSQDTLLLSAFTNNIGTTAPVPPILTAGSTWINNTTNGAWIYNVYDGTNWVMVGTIDNVTHNFIPVGASTAPNVQIFTSSGTYTPTTGLVYAVIEGVGGGGAGAGLTSAAVTGGGGAGGYFWAIATISTIGVSRPITIGAGGAATSTAGGAGGTTSFGSLYSANGGGGGVQYSFTPGPSGVGGTASGGMINIQGQSGTAATANTLGGAGASGLFGSGGGTNFSSLNANGISASGNGAGGGGANASTSGTLFGGAGSPGIIRIVEYL